MRYSIWHDDVKHWNGDDAADAERQREIHEARLGPGVVIIDRDAQGNNPPQKPSKRRT